MNNNVLIKISGLQMVDDTGDNVESMSAGKYYLKKDKHYVLYEDMDDENDEITKNSFQTLRCIAKPKKLQQNKHINRNCRKSRLTILLFGFP